VVAGAVEVSCVVVWSGDVSTSGVCSGEPEPMPASPTTTSTVTATMPARATMTRFDSTGFARRRRGVDGAAVISSAVVKRELYSST
jgi:hypothetical protein